MNTVEVLVFVAVSAILTFGMLSLNLRFDDGFIDAYSLKAKVFSELVRLRNSGARYVLRLDRRTLTVVVLENGISRWREDLDVEIELVLDSGRRGYISYRDGRIVRSGTVYGDGWKLSFQPVSGLMSAGVGK